MRRALDRESQGARRRWAGRLVVPFAIVVLVGCKDPSPKDWGEPLRGQNVTLYHDPGMMPCAGTVPYLDASAAAVAKYLDLPLGDPIPYYYTQDLQPCPPNTVGCTVGPPAAAFACWAKKPDLVHELVHALQWRGRGWSNSFLEEGLAVSLGEFDSVGIADAGATDEDLLTPRQLLPQDFGLAGDFVSYLLTRFGPPSYERLLESVKPDDTPAQIESAFADVFGETMTVLREDRSQSGLTFYANRIDLPECQAFVPDPNLGQGATVGETVDCATNAVGVPGAAVTHVPFDVASDGVYVLKFQLDADTGFGLLACGGGASLSSSNVHENPLVVGYLHAGRYFFNFGSTSDAARTISVAVVPVALGTWPSCASIAPISVPTGTQNVHLFSMDDGTLEVPFVLEDAATLVGINPFSNASRGQICTAGCATSCTSTSVMVNPPKLAAGAMFSLQATFAGQTKLIGENLLPP